MRAAMAKHTKKAQKRKMRPKKEDKVDKKEEKGSGKRKSRTAVVKEQKYRAMRRTRPVRKLAPKIRR